MLRFFLRGDLSFQMTCSILDSEPSPSGAPIQDDASWALLLGLLFGIFQKDSMVYDILILIFIGGVLVNIHGSLENVRCSSWISQLTTFDWSHYLPINHQKKKLNLPF